MQTDYEFCILKNKEEFIEHEKGLFEAFANKTKDLWIQEIYKKIDNDRLKIPIPYEDQIIYLAKLKNKIVGAFSININSLFQIEQMGFKINKTIDICEALSLYVLDNDKKNIGKINYNLTVFGIRDLINRGYSVMYSTCSQKLLPFYKIQGFEELITEPKYLEVLISIKLNKFLEERNL